MKFSVRLRWSSGAALLTSAVLLAGCQRNRGRLPARGTVFYERASAARYMPPFASVWPWRDVATDLPHKGVSHWLNRTSPDGTVVDLLCFDFKANPHLRLELYDQDQDDAQPFDDRADHWSRGIGYVTRHLNEAGRGKIVADWNGLFFATDYKEGGPKGIARHVAPVVLNGSVHYNVGNRRWAFGVKQTDGGGQAFKVMHLPDKETLAREFTFAAGAAQCLIREGKPLKLQEAPKQGEKIPRGPMPSTPEEAGYFPVVDHMRTSRTSMGWSKDSSKLYLLVVKEPDTEMESALAFRHHEPGTGGWTLLDVQRLWETMGVWGAVNVDGGGMTQMAYLRSDGRYEVVPPEWSTRTMRMTFGPDFKDAPLGGSIMYFYIREME